MITWRYSRHAKMTTTILTRNRGTAQPNATVLPAIELRLDFLSKTAAMPPGKAKNIDKRETILSDHASCSIVYLAAGVSL